MVAPPRASARDAAIDAGAVDRDIENGALHAWISLAGVKRELTVELIGATGTIFKRTYAA